MLKINEYHFKKYIPVLPYSSNLMRSLIDHNEDETNNIVECYFAIEKKYCI